MPVVDDSGMKAQLSGVYGFLVEQEEDERRWDANVSRSHWPGAPYPRQRILDDLRAGRTVNVPFCSLPDWARAGAPTRTGRLGRAVCRPERAIVRPDDVITFSDDNWAALWLEENGL